MARNDFSQSRYLILKTDFNVWTSDKVTLFKIVNLLPSRYKSLIKIYRGQSVVELFKCAALKYALKVQNFNMNLI